MVLSSVGNIPFERFIAYAEKYFGGISSNDTSPVERTPPGTYKKKKKETGKRNHQSHCIMGVTCDSSVREFRIGMAMLSHLLGGNGMNTRLNMSLRERNGWVYHVEAVYTPYSDVGVFNVYFAADKTKVGKCVAQIEKELERLKKEPLTAQQLKRLQLQMLGQLAISSDDNDARVLSAGKSMLMFDRVDNLHDICMTINGIDAERLREVANRVFDNLSFLTYH
jgi:predicted Zn-dependent peptidase